MKFVLKKGAPWQEQVDGVLLPSFEGEFSPDLKSLDTKFKGLIKKAIDRGEFTGKEGEIFPVHTQGAIPPERLIIIGLGKREKFNLDKIRQAGAYGVKKARGLKLTKLASPLLIAGDSGYKSEDIARAMVEGIELALYRFTKFKTKDDDKDISDPESWALSIPEGVKKENVRKGLIEGKVLAESVNYVRDLINAPGNMLTPAQFAKEAKKISGQYGLKSTIFNQTQIEKKGMGALLSVAKGSDEKPFFIILEYWGTKKSKKPVALVGKAITFDSGGISIKPSLHMEEMKSDMSGGAAVLGLMRVLGELKPSINVICAIPVAENLPSGKATKPGDVTTSFSGQTIEIVNTDAEGRLILADALSYVKDTYKPSSIIDVATLTGACIVALGKIVTGMMGNDRDLLEKIKKAGEMTYERVWELPLFDEYDEMIKSDVADMKNVGDRTAGTIAGAIFLKRFVGDVPWVHLDIAGTSWTDKESPYNAKGGTGVGVRLLWEFLKSS